MAKKTVVVSLFVFVAMLVLSKSGVFNSLLIFLLIGAVPGTSIVIPPTLMLAVTMACLWVIVFHFTANRFISSRQTKRLIKKHITHKRRMPKRRYSQISS